MAAFKTARSFSLAFAAFAALASLRPELFAAKGDPIFPGLDPRGHEAVGIEELPGDMAQALVEGAASGLAGREVHVTLLEDQSFMVNDCLGIKATAGEFLLRFEKPEVHVDVDGIRFEFGIDRITLNAIKLKMKPRVPTLGNPDPCDWSGSFGLGGSISDIKVQVTCVPRIHLDDCLLTSVTGVSASVSIGSINLESFQNNLDNEAMRLVKKSIDAQLELLLPGFLKDAFKSSALQNICQAKYLIYQSYMAFLSQGVTTYALPGVYVDELQPIYPNVDLRSVRFGYSSHQPSDNATTDCHVMYFNSQQMVQRLRNAELDTSEEWSWLLHELRHTEQCKELGGREPYAQRWFRDLATSLLVTRLSNPAEYFTWLHDNMPMEADAESRAIGTVIIAGGIRDAATGDAVEGAVVTVVPEGAPAGAQAVARSVSGSSGYELPLRPGTYDILVQLPGSGATHVVRESYEVTADADGDGSTDVISLDVSVAGSSVTAGAGEFLRGDANGNGTVDISDALFTLSWLFSNGAASACQKSADANDDGRVDISDPMAVLSYLFLGAHAPAAPFPSRGVDPTEDTLTCGASD